MASFNLPNVTEDMTSEEIVVVVGKMKKTLDWLLMNLDMENMPTVGGIIQDLGGNYSNLSQTVDGIILEVGDIGGNIANLTLTAEGLQSSVTDISGNLSQLTQTVGGIELEVSNIMGDVSNLTIMAQGIQLSVEDLEGNYSALTQTVGGIVSEVSNLNFAVGENYSSISQLSNQISSKVSYTDYNGITIASLINQSASNITISAQAIDLLGITTIYGDPSQGGRATFGTFGDFYITQGLPPYENKIFEIENQIAGIRLLSFNNLFMAYSDVYETTYAHGKWDFSNATVNGLTAIAVFG